MTDVTLQPEPGTQAGRDAIDKVAALAGWFPFDGWKDELTGLVVQAELEATAALRQALEEVRTAAAWRDDLDPQERLRLCLVASRTALELMQYRTPHAALGALGHAPGSMTPPWRRNG